MRRSWPALMLFPLPLCACAAEEPPALRVGTLSFAAEALAAVPRAQYPAVGDAAGWGLAVREAREDSILAPLSRRAAERSRLETLPLALGAESMGLSDADLRTAYEAAPEWELEVRHVVRLADADASMEERLEALEVAEEVLRRATAGEDFTALAAQFSEEPGAAERGGLLQPGRQGTWVAPFWMAAVRLRPGELSRVVETEYGFHVLRLDSRRPVPFAEADRAALLRRLVPASSARAAMERWAADAPPAQLDSAALHTAREGLESGDLPHELVLARGASGATYTASDLAAAWAELEAAERASILDTGVEEFRRWLENDAREALWSVEAANLGAPVMRNAASEALARWRDRSARWASASGFAADMPHDELRAAAVQAATARDQESRIARQELEALRPLLRWAYPLTLPPASAESSSNSEIRKSDSTG